MNKKMIKKKRFAKRRETGKEEGFSLVEVMVGMVITAVALLSLVQMFYLSCMNNVRSDRKTYATFLAQQKVDFLRNFTGEELQVLSQNLIDDQIDLNNDGIIDARRLTRITPSGLFWKVRVIVFSGEQANTASDSLEGDPRRYKVRADIRTVISR